MNKYLYVTLQCLVGGCAALNATLFIAYGHWFSLASALFSAACMWSISRSNRGIIASKASIAASERRIAEITQRMQGLR